MNDSLLFLRWAAARFNDGEAQWLAQEQAKSRPRTTYGFEQAWTALEYLIYDPSVRVRHEGSVTAARGEHLQASTARFREKHVPSRLRRAVLPPLHRELVEWEGRLRRAHGLLRGRGR